MEGLERSGVEGVDRGMCWGVQGWEGGGVGVVGSGEVGGVVLWGVEGGDGRRGRTEGRGVEGMAE